MCGGNKETTVEHIVPEEDKKHMTAKDSAQVSFKFIPLPFYPLSTNMVLLLLCLAGVIQQGA